MGAANVIPGVSGGTIAFITGIYERFILALKNIDWISVRLLFSFKLREFLDRIDARFLITVLLGVGVSILSLARLLEWALVQYESFTLAFFFGLIVASVIGVGRQLQQWRATTFLSLLIGIAIAVFIAFLPPAQSNDAVWYVFLCGIVAVCSMILPGLSGSYILLLMGNYLLVLQAISGLDLGIIIPLGLGCVVGLVAFSRLLSYLFAHYKDITIALLTGFVIGSLLIIWPWKETHYEAITPDKLKAVGYDWLWPQADGPVMIALLLMVIGFLLVWGMERAAIDRSED